MGRFPTAPAFASKDIHPIQSFAAKTLAMKWKRDPQSAVEQGKYEYAKPGSKNTLAELIDRYIERVLPNKPKNEQGQLSRSSRA